MCNPATEFPRSHKIFKILLCNSARASSTPLTTELTANPPLCRWEKPPQNRENTPRERVDSMRQLGGALKVLTGNGSTSTAELQSREAWTILPGAWDCPARPI